MPDDAPKTPKGKKLPKWVIPVGVGGLVLLAFYLRSRKKASESSSTELGTQGLSNQSFIPVTGENVAGVGAGSYGGAVGGESTNNTLLEYIRSSQQSAEHREETQQTFFNELIKNLGTGGGAPISGGGSGTTPVPPQGGGLEIAPSPPPAPSPPKPPVAKCPSSFPAYNPAKGAPGPHSCYKYSRDRCSDKARPYKHVYQDGNVVCSSV